MKKWLDKYDDVPKAENGIEGTMGGLTDVGFNYNGAWGGTMAMGGSMPGAVGFTYARTGSIPSNGPYAKKTKASAQNGRAVSDNTRLKPIVTEKPINFGTVRSTEPFEPKDNRSIFNDSRRKESRDRISKTLEKVTAVGSLSPNPYISVPSGIVNFTLGVTGAPTPSDAGLDYMGLVGSSATPSSLRGFKKIGNRIPFFKGLSFVDALSDIFEFTPSEDLPKKQNGGEMKYYQEGLDWKPRNISQDGTYVKKPRTDMLTMDEYRLQKALANQPQVAPSSNPVGLYEQNKKKQDKVTKLKKYADQNVMKYNDRTGTVEPIYSDNTLKKLDRAMTHFVEPALVTESVLSGAILARGLAKNLAKNLLNPRILLSEGNPAYGQYFHGSSSANIPLLLKQKGLKSFGELEKLGEAPLTGELAFGIGPQGINRTALSTVIARNFDAALDYSLGMAGRGKVDVEKKLNDWFVGGGRDRYIDIVGENPFAPKPQTYDDIYNNRLTQLQNLSEAERKLVEENFPVLYGINPKQGVPNRLQPVSFSGIAGEVGISGGAGLDEFGAMFAPKKYVKDLRKMVGNQVNVLPIERVMNEARLAELKQLKYENGGEIKYYKGQDGRKLKLLLTQPPKGDMESYYPELKRIKEASKVAETKKAAADRANLERAKRKATYVKPGPSEAQSRINRQQATELAKQEALQNSPLAQTLGSFTPSGYNPGAGAVGAETFVNMVPGISIIPSSVRLGQLYKGNDPYGFDQENIISSENALASLGALGDVANVALPTKLGAKATGRFLTEETPLKNAYKINPWAFKANPEAYYRMIGDAGYKDAIESGIIRPPARSFHTEAYYNKGYPLDTRLRDLTGRAGYEGPYMAEVKGMPESFVNENVANYTGPMFDDPVVYSKEPISISNPNVKFYKEDWLRGYKEVPKYVSSPVQNIFSKRFEQLNDQLRFLGLPELNNPNATEVLENFKKRIQTPEGQKRLKDLGITNTKVLDDLTIVGDENTLGQYWMNKIGLNPNLPEVKRVTRHEIEHAVQDAIESSRMNKYKQDANNLKYLFRPKAKKKAIEAAMKPTSEIDDMLGGLELRKTPEKVDWDKIKETRGKREPSELFNYMSDKQRATNYFDSGSGGREKSAFLSEVQQYMMDEGIIPKTSYVEVTPEMVKETFMNAMFDEKGGKYLRLFNIMKPNEANYKLVSDALNKMLTVVPVVGGAAAATSQLEQKEKGGKIKKDDMGYWNPENWGEPVEIGSNEITMEGVYEPLLGISDTGDVQMMYPGEDYTFDGESVTEYPIAKSGMSVNNADAQPIEKLDQSLNFTNYNKPTKGGWLDKYQ